MADYDPGAYSVADVKAYVQEHPDEADDVLAAEEAGQNRTTLVTWLDGFEPTDEGDTVADDTPDTPTQVEAAEPEHQTIKRLPPETTAGPFFPSGMSAPEAAMAGATAGMSDRDQAKIQDLAKEYQFDEGVDPSVDNSV